MPDARPAPYPPPAARLLLPRHDRIEIRIGGAWYLGHVQRWALLPDRSWRVWLSYQADPAHPTVAPVWGWYAWDPEAIRPVLPPPP